MIPSLDEKANEFLRKYDAIYVVRVGSHAYGLATEDSDDDIRGVYQPKLSDMIDGFPVAKTVEYSDGDTDIVLHPIHKFLKLCAQSNPNLLDWLFVPDECVLLKDRAFWFQVIGRRYMFLTRQLHPRFKGYGMSHFEKMSRGMTRELGEKRKKDIAEHGYSTKNAMHLIRLLRMGAEALETGEMNVRRIHDRDELLAIRRGEWSQEEVIRAGTILFGRLDEALAVTKLPERADIDEVKKMLMKVVLSRSGLIDI